MGVQVIATSSYLPTSVITNDDWAKRVDTSDEWIVKRTGIKTRYWAKEQTTSDLATIAAKRLVEKSNISPESIEFIIVATMTPDAASPSCASLVQGAIGATNAFAFDISAACSGFVFALSTGLKMLEHGQRKYGIVIGAETMLSSLDWEDRSTAILFGDGAGAVLLQKDEEPFLLAETLQNDGQKSEALVAGKRMTNQTLSTMTMDGRGVYELVSKTVPVNIQETLQKAGYTADDIDLYLLHQANRRLVEQVAKKLKQPIEKFPMNIDHVGNTSAGSIPILLNELVENGTLKIGKNTKLLLSGFGGGLAWGSITITL